MGQETRARARRRSRARARAFYRLRFPGSSGSGSSGSGRGSDSGSGGGGYGVRRRYERCVWVTLLSLLVDDYTGDGDADGDWGHYFQDHQTNTDDNATADGNSHHHNHDNDDYDNSDDDDDNDIDVDANGEDKDERGYSSSTNVLNIPPLPPLLPGTLIEHIQGLDTLASLLDSPHASRVRGASRMVQALLQVNTNYCHFIRKYSSFSVVAFQPCFLSNNPYVNPQFSY